MIHTLTLNPSLDYIAECPHFTLSKTNRTTKETILPGGKGINVSLVLNNLGHRSITHGFVSGFTGDALISLLQQTDLAYDMIRVDQGFTRINVKLKSEEETELNGMGPVISKTDLQQLMSSLSQLSNGDILVLSGSIPQGVSKNIYSLIMQEVRDRNVLCIVDTSGSSLTDCLPWHPFLIKPNRDELQQLSNTPLNTREDIISAAMHLHENGAQNVIVSLGGQGAIMVCMDGSIYQTDAPSGIPVNSVGAGDSLVAGFLAAYLETQDVVHAFHYGVACGSASAFSAGFASRQETDALMQTFTPVKIR